MTFHAPSKAASTVGKVNYDTKARVKIDASAEVLRRALAATAGASNAIDDRTFGLIRDEEEYDLCYAAPRTTWWPTVGTSYYDVHDDDDVSSINWNRYMQIRPLDLGGGISVIGAQPNPQSVVEYLIPTQLTPVNVDPVSEYRTTRRAAVVGRGNALAHISKNLDATAGAYAQNAPQDVIRRLTELGVSQLIIARALGVTPTAVRKWRRGEAAKADHRSRLARFAGTYSLLGETGVHDPAGWLDIPISNESTLTPLDLFIGGRADLSILLGARLMEPQEALDAYQPGWRQTNPIDPDYEVVMLRDGSRSAVPRKRDGSN